MAAQRQILVLVADPVDPGLVAAAVARLIGASDHVRVVVSPTVSRLEKLTNQEDAARTEARELAEAVAAVLPGTEAPAPASADVEPMLAVEDALRLYPADLVVVLRTAETGEQTAGFQGLTVPVTVVTVPAAS